MDCACEDDHMVHAVSGLCAPLSIVVRLRPRRSGTRSAGLSPSGGTTSRRMDPTSSDAASDHAETTAREACTTGYTPTCNTA
jgi:hypothetical protein